MWHRHFIRRQLRHSKQHATIFVLCVALSMVTLVAVGGLSQSVHTSLLRDARALHAGDIIMHSHYPLAAPMATAALASAMPLILASNSNSSPSAVNAGWSRFSASWSLRGKNSLSSLR